MVKNYLFLRAAIPIFFNFVHQNQPEIIAIQTYPFADIWTGIQTLTRRNFRQLLQIKMGIL